MNLKDYNPFGTFRPHQEEAIKEILEVKATGVPNIILKAPVASGKSLIAYTVAQYLMREKKENTLIFTSTKLLQDQYLRDFPRLKTVKGRNNFDCVNNGRTCDKGSCKEICNFKCMNSVEFRDGLDDLLYKKSIMDVCPYWEQKTRAIWAPISIINYKFGLIDRNYVHHFFKRDFVVFDEAHNLEKEIMDFFEVEISPRQLQRDIKYKIPAVQTLSNWADVFFEISSHYEDASKEMTEIGDKKRADNFKSKKETYKKTGLLIQQNPENWVIDYDDNTKNLIFKPILINLYAESALLSFGNTRLFMSGSILKNNSFCETLGIEDYHIVEVPSIINPNHRPIFKEYVGSMSMRNRNNTLPRLAEKIVDIANRYPDDKGVVHTYTYIISNMLQAVLEDNDRFIFHNSQNRQSQTQKFIDTDEPKILVSPYSFEGVDFKDDLARFQIIAKNPFPNMFQNNQYKERDRISDFHWIFEQRCKVLSQMYGRIVRTPSDFGDTYLIDSDIEGLLGPSSLVTGYMFEGFIDNWMNKEIVIVDETRLTQDKRKSYEVERQNEIAILNEIKRLNKPTVVKLVEMYKNLPNDAYKEIRPICERLLKNKAIKVI